MIGIALVVSISACLIPGDTSLNQLHREMAKLQIYMSPPPAFANPDTCFHYSQLIILEIDRKGKIADFITNDPAPDWLKEDLRKQKQQNPHFIKRLDSLVSKTKIVNCKIIFPLILESANHSCSPIKMIDLFTPDFYNIKGKSLRGNILFGPQLLFSWPSTFRR